MENVYDKQSYLAGLEVGAKIIINKPMSNKERNTNSKQITRRRE